jgi:hypothetical protein
MDDLNFNELNKLSKEELEKIKLAQDLSTYKERFELEKKSISSKKGETLRLLIVALITAIVSLGTNYIIESYKSRTNKEIEILKAETSKINDYTKSFETEIIPIHLLSGAARKKAVCDAAKFDNIYNDKIIQSKINAYAILCNSFDSTVAITQPTISRNDSVIQKTAEIVDNSKTATSNAKKLEDLDRKINVAYLDLIGTTDIKKKQVLEKEATQLKNDASAIINSDPLIKKAKIASDSAQEAFKTQQDVINLSVSLPVNNLKSSVLIYRSSGWFKEGYFLQFEDVRVSLMDLSKSDQTIKVDLCNQIGPGECTHPISSQTISISTSYTFLLGDFTCKITLDRIGSAGVNPFKPAAFITFEKYKK